MCSEFRLITPQRVFGYLYLGIEGGFIGRVLRVADRPEWWIQGRD